MSAFKVDNEIIPSDSNEKFQCILLSKEKTEGLKHYIDYELAPILATFFDYIGFRKTVKSKLYGLLHLYKIIGNLQRENNTYFSNYILEILQICWELQAMYCGF